MTTSENQPAEPSDHGPFQFSLRGLMWFTTVVAVTCASFACAKRAWGESGVYVWSGLVFLLWPSLAALVVWSCPEISFKARVRMYGFIGAGVVLVTWSRAWPPYPALLGAFVATVLAALIVSAPQGLAVFAAMTYARERGGQRDANDGDELAAANGGIGAPPDDRDGSP